MGIYSTAQLRRRGVGKTGLAALVQDGVLVRVRRGMFADSSATPDEVEAVRVGGRLGCVSALRALGVWVTPGVILHVHLAPNASRLRSGVAVRHWDPALRAGAPTCVDVLDALLAAMLCLALPDAVAAVDSALHLRLISVSDLGSHCRDGRRRSVLALVDARSESGLESLIRVAILLAGLRVELQVRIAGVGRVDLLVEGCVVVEADGAAYHAGTRRHADYLRDAGSTIGGFTALRFDSAQILGDLPSVVLAIIAAVERHRGGRFSGRDADSARNRVARALPA